MVDNAKKFFFDNNDFDEEAIARKKAALKNAPPTFTVEQMETAKADAYNAGVREGKTEALNAVEKQTADTLGQVLNQIRLMVAGENERTALFSDQSALLAAQIVSKIFPTFAHQAGEAEILAFVRQAVSSGLHSGAVLVRVSPDRLAPIVQRAEQEPELADLLHSGKLQISADRSLQPNECNARWDKGGAFWSADRIFDAISAALAPLVAHAPDGDTPEAMDGEKQTAHTGADGE